MIRVQVELLVLGEDNYMPEPSFQSNAPSDSDIIAVNRILADRRNERKNKTKKLRKHRSKRIKNYSH